MAGRSERIRTRTLDRGATCAKNAECASGSCYVGYGNLGYCTHICNSELDCEDFWECKHVGNAPRRVCKQQEE